MSTVDVLRQVWLFSGLDEQQLEAVSSFTFQKSFGPGELIVEEGRTGNGMYAIISGNVEAVKALGTEQERILNRLGTGEVFGEMALLGEWPRTASVRAVDEVECLGIDRWVFLTQLERHPQVGIRLLQVLAQKLRDSDARLVE
ncbi:MAG: cyclic nucleotide-binding domain-containing protein [Chloroflexi bacterium]|nr:cyclic nucleotide-binding domain-containing protein [Chloroflexota bacterium]MCH8348980.1 cyclic nucleotide-binding domain-containing protein [Chloroflexota bacterium]MCI0780511.1 cyclic nucleotide-binding domain-containing protein [Chloroflexota bacterium]MCI0786375.1 cyclic nucleotide-binding domain-containing protein [Chloroflexota bacterium]MCI0793628.1 cyclic nucleotide-binding domain-containing protein [Chloroflexota bacterium]